MRVELNFPAEAWQDKPGVRGVLKTRFERYIVKVKGYEVRYNLTYGTIYIPSYSGNWPSNGELVLNGVNYGVPHRRAGHGVTWDKIKVDVTLGTMPEPEEFEEAPSMWTSIPVSLKQCQQWIGDVFVADAPARKNYFDIKARWYYREGPPGFRRYPRRGDMTWEDLFAAQEAFEKMKVKVRNRIDELVAYIPSLQRQKEEEEKRRREDRRKPVDLTDPKQKREYENRNRRLMAEQRQNQEEALVIAESKLDQYTSLPHHEQDGTTLMRLRRTVERIRWELDGCKEETKPHWID